MSIILVSLLVSVVGYGLYLIIHRKKAAYIFNWQEYLHAPTTTRPLSNSFISNHALCFPPSCRHMLPDTTTDFVTDLREQHTKLLPDKQRIDPFEHRNHFTPTGVTLREIHHLGDFPDYASLSGVPLPEAYPEFDIAKAAARPYRPFRWAYHQTMCKQAAVLPVNVLTRNTSTTEARPKLVA